MNRQMLPLCCCGFACIMLQQRHHAERLMAEYERGTACCSHRRKRSQSSGTWTLRHRHWRNTRGQCRSRRGRKVGRHIQRHHAERLMPEYERGRASCSQRRKRSQSSGDRTVRNRHRNKTRGHCRSRRSRKIGHHIPLNQNSYG